MQKNAKESIKYIKNNKKGITLVALVVTIVVLLILAGVTITSLLGDDGIIKKAGEAANKMNEAIQTEQSELNALIEELNSIMAGHGGGGPGSGGDDNPPVVEPPKVSDNLGSVISTTANTDLTDSYGNKISVPAGFYIVTTAQDSTVEYDYSGDGIPAVQDGIVIQNEEDGNQFVWVPVGTINNKTDDALGATTTIKLGRYSNFTMSGTTLPTPAQEATVDGYNMAVLINTYYFEVSDSFAGDADQSLNAASSYGNTKATNLQEWISTSLANGGYYIARYEASQNGTETTKAASVKNVQPWVDITQPNAAIAAKATYPSTGGTNSSNYYSDLINSYAWDSAIVFIQAYDDSSYASKNYSTSETVTGGNGDQVCNINDMSGNKYEWSTETSTRSLGSLDYHCAKRGGYYHSDVSYAYDSTSYRGNSTTDSNPSTGSFRLTLYVK